MASNRGKKDQDSNQTMPIYLKNDTVVNRLEEISLYTNIKEWRLKSMQTITQ